ncbi:hypothetical protein AAY473_030879 [Plecturocebus cupreus]
MPSQALFHFKGECLFPTKETLGRALWKRPRNERIRIPSQEPCALLFIHPCPAAFSQKWISPATRVGTREIDPFSRAKMKTSTIRTPKAYVLDNEMQSDGRLNEFSWIPSTCKCDNAVDIKAAYITA